MCTGLTLRVALPAGMTLSQLGMGVEWWAGREGMEEEGLETSLAFDRNWVGWLLLKQNASILPSDTWKHLPNSAGLFYPPPTSSICQPTPTLPLQLQRGENSDGCCSAGLLLYNWVTF